MNVMKWVFILLLVFVFIGVSGYFLYDNAFAWGEKTGYESAYPEGKKVGFVSGKQAGYEDGYSLGKADGYDEGYEEGYLSGEQSGYGKGYTAGKDDGYTEGYSTINEDFFEHGYTLRDPTYQEVIAFLKDDKTDENAFIEGTYGFYVCSHFARDVNNNAQEQGIRCALIELRYPDSGHSIIAFDTIDEGLVYFDPQSDERVRPEVGKNYYQCVEPKPGYYYEKPPYDDTIMDILVIW